MKSNISNFITRLLLFSLVLAAMAYGLTFLLPAKYISPVMFLLFPFFYLATVIMYNYLLKSPEKKFNSFANRFMVVTFIKLLVYTAVLVAYVFTHKEDAVPFIFSFFILYISYTVYEVMELLKLNSKGKR